MSSALPVGKCKLTDKAGMLTAFRKMLPTFTSGMPKYGVNILDPMPMDVMKFDLNGLQFCLTGGILKGLKAAVIDDVNWDLDKKVFYIDLHVNISVVGAYTAAGKVMIHPITGDGQLNLKMENLKIKFFIHYDMVKCGSKDHVKPTKYTFEFDVIDNASFHLSNLFNGDKEPSDAMLAFLNENWKGISTEFGGPLMDTILKDVFKSIANFFEKLPIKDIANI